MDIKITYNEKPITRNMIQTDQKTAPKTLHLLTFLSTRWGTVNTKEHCSMTIMVNTHFPYLKSSKNKISSRNCSFLLLDWFDVKQQAHHLYQTVGERLQTKTRRCQGCTVSLITLRAKPCGIGHTNAISETHS